MTRATSVGIVTDYMLEGGAEAVTEALCQKFPEARVYTSLLDDELVGAFPAVAKAFADGRVATGVAQYLWPLIRRFRSLSAYHFYWLCFLLALFQRTGKHDVVFVTCSAQAKLFRIPRSARVIVYFHTPTRWLYPGLMSEDDLAAVPSIFRHLMSAFNLILGPLDRIGMRRLKAHDPVWLCNSSYTKANLAQIYDIEADVVYPPIATERFAMIDRQPDDFFLYHGRITYQKRVDIAVRGCLRADKKLMVSGACLDPSLQSHLEQIVAEAVTAEPKKAGLITFLGRTSDDELLDLLSRCRALIFPPREDFGIAPIESIASGVPVIAYGAGGALDYIKPGVNGCFFVDQSAESLSDALAEFDSYAFEPATVAGSLPDMSAERFHSEIHEHAGLFGIGTE